MKNLAYNLNSVEIFYGDNTLTSVIQLHERIENIGDYVNNIQQPYSEMEQQQITERLDKLVSLNQKIQQELEMQVEKLNAIKTNLNREMKLI